MITINKAVCDINNITHTGNTITIPVTLELNRMIPADKEVRAIVVQNLRALLNSLEGNLI